MKVENELLLLPIVCKHQFTQTINSYNAAQIALSHNYGWNQ